MGDPTGNIYYSSTPSSRIPHPRQPSHSDEQNILPHHWSPLPCEVPYHPYLAAGENTAQNISVQFMHPCPTQDAAQLDSDIFAQRLIPDEESPVIACHPIAYPESSQRTTSNALSPYASEASRFNDVSACDLATLHIVDGPPHGTQAFRRGSWPSHAVMEYPHWPHSPPRAAGSPASEPPESTSDESYLDSDCEEATRMSPMMNHFQIQSSWNVDASPHHMHRAQALQPSVMTFQLSETMLQPVYDPENRHMLRSLLNMSIIADDEPEVTHPSPSSGLSSLYPASAFGSTSFQGSSSMRHLQGAEKAIKTNQIRVPLPTSHKTASPLSHSLANPGIGDQRSSGPRQQKKSKMHQCEQCKKVFPRPSGLATHMNTHSGAKPYKCIIPNCEKSFAVRSNAKRHLRTHGVNPSYPGAISIPRYTVGFEKPMVTQVHDAGKQPSRYRWITHNLSPHEGEWLHSGPSSVVDDGPHTDIVFQASMSSALSSALSNSSDEDHEAGPSSLVDVQQHQGDYKRATHKFSDASSNYGAHPR